MVPSARTAPDTADRVVALLTQVASCRCGRARRAGFHRQPAAARAVARRSRGIAEGVCDPKTVDLRGTQHHCCDWPPQMLVLTTPGWTSPCYPRRGDPEPQTTTRTPARCWGTGRRWHLGRVPVTAFWTGPQEPARPPPPDLPSTSPRNSANEKEGGHSLDVRLASAPPN